MFKITFAASMIAIWFILSVSAALAAETLSLSAQTLDSLKSSSRYMFVVGVFHGLVADHLGLCAGSTQAWLQPCGPYHQRVGRSFCTGSATAAFVVFLRSDCPS